MSLKNWFSKMVEKSAAPSVGQVAPPKESEVVESHFDYTERALKNEHTKTPESLRTERTAAEILQKQYEKSMMMGDMLNAIKPGSIQIKQDSFFKYDMVSRDAGGGVFMTKDGSIKIPTDAENWCIMSRRGNTFVVSTPDDTFETLSWFEAMMHMADFHGVDPNEDLDG